MSLRLVLAIPMADLLAYRKLSRAWFTLNEVRARAMRDPCALCLLAPLLTATDESADPWLRESNP